MPVYNGARFLRHAVDSILAQTCADFELLVINDGSTDQSAVLLNSYDDPRIRLVDNERNLGLIATLNRGIDLARGAYLLRMDCDDISLPERLQRQVDFLDANPRVGVCGVWYREFWESGSRVMRCPPDHAGIKCGTLFNPSVGHPSVIMRKSALLANGLRYDPAFQHAEDYELWARALDCFEFANIPELLLCYRIHEHQVTRSCAEQQMQSAGKVRLSLLKKLGLEPDAQEFEIHQMLSALTRPIRFGFQSLPVACQLDSIDRWLCRLKEGNDRHAVYPEPHFSRMLIERWVGVCCLNYIASGNWSPRLFVSPRLFSLTGAGWPRAFGFAGKRLLGMLGDLRHRYVRPCPVTDAGKVEASR